MPGVKDSVKQLLDYVQAVEEMKLQAPRQIPSELFRVHQHELKGAEGVQFDGRDGDDVWLRIQRLEETPPPTLPEALTAWVTLGRSPNTAPKLNATITVPGEPDPQLIALASVPEIEHAFEAYVADIWTPWATREARRRKTIALYRRLFVLQQAIVNEGTDRPVELVWGMAVASWRAPDNGVAITYPLLTQLCEVCINEGTFALEVRSSAARPKLESACYAELGLPGVKPLEDQWRALQQAEGDTINPFETSTFEPLARLAASHLDTGGRYDLLEDDPALPAPTDQLVVTSAWVVFARTRSSDIIVSDIKALKAAVEKAQDIPDLVRSFVEQSTDPVRFAPKREYRGISSSFHGDGAEELFFPLPYNEEQVSIIERLAHADGVVVQGPPGTGKSHTICNVICHYLAQGKSVLVTAKSETALAVVQEKLPGMIRPLSVALLSGESDGNRQFEHNVRAIDAEISRITPDRSEAEIARLQSDLDRHHAAIAEIDKQVDARARANLQPINVDGKEVSPAVIAQQVVEGQAAYEWFDDRPTGSAIDPRVTEQVIEELRRARREVGDYIGLVGVNLPVADELPTVEQLLETHRDLVRTDALTSATQRGDFAPLVDASVATYDSLKRLVAAIEQRAALLVALQPHAWAQPAVTTLRRSGPSDPLAVTLRTLVDQVLALDTARREQVAKALVVGDGAEHDPVLRQAIARSAEGARPFLMPFGNAPQRVALAACMIEGRPVSTPEGWRTIEAALALRDEVGKVLAQWRSIAGEIGLGAPQDAALVPAFRELVGLAQASRAALDLAFDVEPLIEGLARAAFGPTRFPTGEALLDVLPSVLASAQTHLERGRLAYAMQDRQRYLDRLQGRDGALATALCAFFAETLGAPAIDDDALRGQWQALQRELATQTRLQPALRTTALICALIAEAGAPKWAERLQTEPADATTDLDRLTPGSWRDAWTWRRHAMFIDRIDAHSELRRLFEERRRLVIALAKTYQDIVAAKTWLGVAKNASTAVRAALKAYLTAVLAMGRGTGRNAVLLRRDAKRAMTQAFRGVPVWILPHWRVSESLPAQIGMFDLVVVDEASQSDMSCLPAVLRGKQLLVVGDDKQVSPSIVGVSVEQLSDLRNRFLHAFPETIGPLLLPGRSLYELANVVFAGQNVMLREHFRSVEPIIAFSNRAYYDDKIVALRVPTADERLDPPLVDIHVVGGRRVGDVNLLEVRAIIDEIESILADPALVGRSIGIVTLLGTAQAHAIHARLTERIPMRDILARGIVVGPPPVFQGRERDIMLVSMVIDPTNRGATDKTENHQRFNVAMSRARDRMMLFRSITEADVNPTSITSRVLAYFRQPHQVDHQRADQLRGLCESGFEEDVFDALVQLGYRVTPQVKVGPYRIDLVVDDHTGRRIAIECDGDRFHGPGQWPDDMARQRTLERAGWTFWRCFASTWVRNREQCLDDVRAAIKGLGIGTADPANLPRLCESRIYEPAHAEDPAQDEDAPALETRAESSREASDGAPAIRSRVEPEARTPPPQPLPFVVFSTTPVTIVEAASVIGAAEINADVVRAVMLSLIPSDGTAVGNVTLRRDLSDRLGCEVDELTYFEIRRRLIEDGSVETGRGRGGSVKRRDAVAT
jgi:very-short-patch-repair endonuclease